MKKTYLIIIIVSSLVFSCEERYKSIDIKSITHIDVYHIPFSIMLPLGITQEEIKLDVHKKKITNKERILEIGNALLTLKKTKDAEFIDTGIYLRIDFYSNDKEVLKVLFDKRYFKIGSNTYMKNTRLVDLVMPPATARVR